LYTCIYTCTTRTANGFIVSYTHIGTWSGYFGGSIIIQFVDVHIYIHAFIICTSNMGTPTLHFVYMELAATSVCIKVRVYSCRVLLNYSSERHGGKENPRSVGHMGYRTRVYMKMFKITRTERVYYYRYTCV